VSIITAASGQSVCRGYEYYSSGRVILFSEIEPGKFKGSVSGSAASPYSVMIDAAHPRKSACDCPHANGRIICKHMVALFFAAYPEEAERYHAEVTAYEEEQEKYWQEMEQKIDRYVCGLKKEELRALVFRLIGDMTEWQYERFVRDYIDWDDDDDW